MPLRTGSRVEFAEHADAIGVDAEALGATQEFAAVGRGHGQHQVGARELGVPDPVGGVAGDGDGDRTGGGVTSGAVVPLGQKTTSTAVDGVAALLIGDARGGHDDAGAPRGGDSGSSQAIDEHDLGHGRAADVAGADHGDRVRGVAVAGRRQVGWRNSDGHAGQALAHGAPMASRLSMNFSGSLRLSQPIEAVSSNLVKATCAGSRA